MTDDKDAEIRAMNDRDIASWANFLDLQVPLTIELGRTGLTARAVLELEVQSIIRLQRSTAEGVDVAAGSFHIARGEIITIEDRTGVRLNEIVMSKRTSD